MIQRSYRKLLLPENAKCVIEDVQLQVMALQAFKDPQKMQEFRKLFSVA